ncbi:hypothetical protein PENANT_c017G04302 [Penicillium antarcticum]|uniref:Cupin type-2 domain-containing protein n=1 Tax=Penicillium antarcticum TaxID=416450 RepID=A0A1V6Q2D0_9EURO|nr:RmlC-like cupin [Penicillium antarcticum]KAJ5306302.1 RmlC-like cupin [Penicillium antarcticum]OQD83411.1 hypothetical protein PENANT_c017G04302 [Penicillium antarcticum]
MASITQTVDHVGEDLTMFPSEKHYAPLWTVLDKMVPPRPNPRAVPTVWRYNEMRPDLMKAGSIVTAEEAERRVLMLVNSNIEPPYTTDTIYGGLQLVLPGETAPAHRHVAFALRFIIEGEHGFTAIEGQKISMEIGDVILTPSWCWHDHGNEGTKPMVWLDGLDLPLFRNVPVNFAENYTSSRYPAIASEESPIQFPWRDVQNALDGDKLPYTIYHYSRKGQRHLSNTISAQAERLDAGFTASPRQETCSFLYHVKSGEGVSNLITSDGNKTEIRWKEKDTFVVPAWCRIEHTCSSAEPAYLFAINDRPLLESLGLVRRA